MIGGERYKKRAFHRSCVFIDVVIFFLYTGYVIKSAILSKI